MPDLGESFIAYAQLIRWMETNILVLLAKPLVILIYYKCQMSTLEYVQDLLGSGECVML